MAPGRYTAELMVVSAAGVRRLGAPQAFEVRPVPTTPPGTDFVTVAAFQQQTAEVQRRVGAAQAELGRVTEQLRHLRAALVRTPRADPALVARMDSLDRAVTALSLRLNWDAVRGRLDESAAPSIAGRVGQVIAGHWDTRMMPTATQRRDLEIASAALDALVRELAALIEGDLARLEADLERAGAPWTPGRRLPPPR
jgi:hypothetical protein